ncbi:YgfZ/GcvT domain-containing protein [Thermomonas carbonis]|uniref:Folate-binding protein YgfZ n=1 Tax=Thermomonas carbonis TaxID=1463158 RepID=A0A7G9SMZ9_9GAMM|nr:folate-binding protein YgfZ [Thermomonas carbonis]QNN69224.1 folate-binding protein YgfZ [Thermomonas carbonis]
MSHNPQAASTKEFRLPGHDVLAISGRDAMAFAQAQFMNDVAALGDGQWHWNGWLTPKGRLIALFALLRLDAETLWLLLPDVDAAGLATQLQRFVFRSKVKLEPRDDLHISGQFAAPTAASGSAAAPIDGGIELDLGVDGGPRCLRISSIEATPDEALAARWRAFDIAHGLPRLAADQSEAWTPQQLSLDRLRAFSVKKGCYPGQEIVARTHFLGKVKRELVRLQGAGVGELDEVMEGEPPMGRFATVRPIGQLICAEGDEGLAVMPIDAGDGPFSTGDQPCTRLPLLDGLAR